MKGIITAFALFAILNCFGQKSILHRSRNDTAKFVSFVTKFHMTELDKDDAAILNGYVVNVGYEQAKKLNGKRIRITGKVTVIKDEIKGPPGTPPYQQRQIPYKYIASPKIEIIKR